MARDNNRVPNLYGVSSADMTTVLPVRFDPVTNRLLCKAVSPNGTAADSVDVAPRDGNGVPAGMAKRSDTDGVLAIRINADTNGWMIKAN